MVRTTTYGVKALKYSGCILWNELPMAVRKVASKKVFSKMVKHNMSEKYNQTQLRILSTINLVYYMSIPRVQGYIHPPIPGFYLKLSNSSNLLSNDIVVSYQKPWWFLLGKSHKGF